MSKLTMARWDKYLHCVPSHTDTYYTHAQQELLLNWNEYAIINIWSWNSFNGLTTISLKIIYPKKFISFFSSCCSIRTTNNHFYSISRFLRWEKAISMNWKKKKRGLCASTLTHLTHSHKYTHAICRIFSPNLLFEPAKSILNALWN